MKVSLNQYFLLTLPCYTGTSAAYTQDVTITVEAAQGRRAISPYIYGRNNRFDKPASFYSDAGLRFARICGGNNATKYNWRRKISSHPDWYNNVYGNSWDEMSEYIAENHPDMQVMWAFQLLGRVASSGDHNFNDWAYNNSQWWEGVNQNLAGGGTVNESGVNPSKAAVEGDVNLYTEEWPADSTMAILNHWFGQDGLGLNKNQFAYWHLFSRYAKSYRVSSTSSLENTVSAYTSLNETSDSMTIIIVNRDMNSEQNVRVNLNDCIINDGNYTTLQLSSLPSAETFVSHSDNAITESTVEASSNSFTITVPALSTTAVLFSSIVVGIENYIGRVDELKIFPNPASDKFYIELNSSIAEPVEILVYDQGGCPIRSFTQFYDGNSTIEVNTSSLVDGFYFLSVGNTSGISVGSFALIR